MVQQAGHVSQEEGPCLRLRRHRRGEGNLGQRWSQRGRSAVGLGRVLLHRQGRVEGGGTS